MEELAKKCPRCHGRSANPSNPAGRCRACLNKLNAKRHTPGTKERAWNKADGAHRRDEGRNGTAYAKSKGRMKDRKSFIKRFQRDEKKAHSKLSPDRKANGVGYTNSNVRNVPEKLNRGRHHVNKKKLRSWQRRLNKTETSYDELYTYLLLKATEANDAALLSFLEDMHPNDVANFINNEDLHKSVAEELDNLLKDEANMVPGWSRAPNTSEGVHAWRHPKHGIITMNTTGGKFNVSHNAGSVGSFNDSAQAVEMTRRYMQNIGAH